MIKLKVSNTDDLNRDAGSVSSDLIKQVTADEILHIAKIDKFLATEVIVFTVNEVIVLDVDSKITKIFKTTERVKYDTISGMRVSIGEPLGRYNYSPIKYQFISGGAKLFEIKYDTQYYILKYDYGINQQVLDLIHSVINAVSDNADIGSFSYYFDRQLKLINEINCVYSGKCDKYKGRKPNPEKILSDLFAGYVECMPFVENEEQEEDLLYSVNQCYILLASSVMKRIWRLADGADSPSALLKIINKFVDTYIRALRECLQYMVYFSSVLPGVWYQITTKDALLDEIMVEWISIYCDKDLNPFVLDKPIHAVVDMVSVFTAGVSTDDIVLDKCLIFLKHAFTKIGQSLPIDMDPIEQEMDEMSSESQTLQEMIVEINQMLDKEVYRLLECCRGVVSDSIRRNALDKDADPLWRKSKDRQIKKAASSASNEASAESSHEANSAESAEVSPAEEAPSAGREGIAQISAVVSLAREHLKEMSGVYLAPNIPDKKLRGANKKLLPQADPDDRLIGLIDTTLFGGGADGVAIFERYIIYANLAEDTKQYQYDDLKRLPVECNKGDVTAGDITFKLYDNDTAKAFTVFLRDVYEVGVVNKD